MKWSRKRSRRTWLRRTVIVGIAVSGALGLGAGPESTKALGTHVVFGYNDLGMHCMNSDFSEIMVLPPFNNLRAQVIRRGAEPHIVTSGVTVRYVIPGNTYSAGKTNFWKFPQPLLGPAPLPNIGLTGNGLAGTMVVTTAGDYEASGIPVTPIDDNGRENPYPLAAITVLRNGLPVARTQAVVPVSTEMSCNLCHNSAGVSTATDILQDHDRLHGTHLVDEKPVLCARCHASNALGLPGQPELPNLSRAMHGAHAPRMGGVGLTEVCYACHPGVRTKCQRDVHQGAGTTCTSCHGDMAAVASPARTPWVTEPRCGNCHTRAGFEFEQPGTLFRNSIGHGGVKCISCHGSPHAITPTITEVDNLQAIQLQGHGGVIDTCTVCHTVQPGEAFFHRVNDK